MENLLNKQTVNLTRCVEYRQEEYAVSGDYTLPEYCPDVSSVLKCLMVPRIQNRQLSGDQLLIDGETYIRVIYVDDERKCIRCAEFSLPFSCSVKGMTGIDTSLPYLQVTTKYVNCRAVTSRRLEVRGAAVVTVRFDQVIQRNLVTEATSCELFCKKESITYTKPSSSVERVITVSESLRFPDGNPAAEMLLGGDCRAVIRECKILSGKVIVKGEVYIHQLYTGNVSAGDTYHLDYALPFSQILDVDGIEEKQPFGAQVLVLSDTERCNVGPEGVANLMEFTAKLLVRFQAYQQETAEILLDVFHTGCPTDVKCDEIHLCAHHGMTIEQSVLPLQLELPERNVREIIDVWVSPQITTTHCENEMVHINGRLQISVLYRDTENCVCYYEQVEEFHLEYPCMGKEAVAEVEVSEVRYRLIENKLEIQVSVCTPVHTMTSTQCRVVEDATLHTESPYPMSRAAALVYYASAGESLWDVGKHCHASPEKIYSENGVSGELIESPSVLLVPIV